MKKIWIVWVILLLYLSGCSRYKQMSPYATTPAPIVVERTKNDGKNATGESESISEAGSLTVETAPDRIPVKVKGVYVSAYAAGSPALIESLLEELEKTEINTVVIDIKGDEGYVTCEMDSPMVSELNSVKRYIPDMEALMKKLKARDIYTIARIAAFRDPLMGEKQPDWCIKNTDGSLFKDNSGMTWLNPYKEETWDYLVEIGIAAKRLGFNEVQFDYIRFCTERGMNKVAFETEDQQGRSKTEVITEFMDYAYQKLKAEGLFVSADVFGAIIDSGIDAKAIGQHYGEMAKHLDYISPMIYPSHYADGYFGLDHPDLQPYDTIMEALAASNKTLAETAADGSRIAVVRPWLQDFTASYLKHYIPYGDAEVRAQIQAVYNSGHDEWLLWNASVKYHWGALLTPAEAEAEALTIRESRAARQTQPETEEMFAGATAESEE